jgi:hypothetical protein
MQCFICVSRPFGTTAEHGQWTHFPSNGSSKQQVKLLLTAVQMT